MTISVQKSSDGLRVQAHQHLPHVPEPKGGLQVSPLGQASVTVFQPSKKNCFFLQSLLTLHATFLMQNHANVSRKNQLPWCGCPTEKVTEETCSFLHTTYHKALNLWSATSMSQLSKLCLTTYHFLVNWLTQKSRRETVSAVGKKQWVQPAKLACFRAGRGHSLGTKSNGYGLPWNKQWNGDQTMEVMRRKEREERAHQGKELSTSTAVNSPKFHPSSWFPSFQI